MAPIDVALLCILVIMAIAAYYVYTHGPKPKPTCVSESGAPGTCDTDKDCHAPNGVCKKGPEGACVCDCAPGYSGTHCKTKGVPWNSYNCMGPNKTPPNPSPRKDGNGLCVCPPGHWASGIDPATRQYVQCLNCSGDWGPLGVPIACTLKWANQETVATNNCYSQDHESQKVACGLEYGAFASETGPHGEKGGAYLAGLCDGGPPCSSCPSNKGGQIECNLSGWVIPGKAFPTCGTAERPCSSYTCSTL
jgi:hypothetical protein